ncbi:MAG TPA: ABC transporter substrate-binding protein [Spirochaetia bacterium]|nr:ABC transporter substrate-binding protein [Spirochaetia bacterium]
MTLKRVLTIAVLLLAGAGMLFANGQQEGSQPAGQAASSSAPVKLHVFQFKPYLDHQFKDFATDFEKQYPNVTVTTETIGGGTQWQTILKSKFAAGEGPDIFPVEGTGEYNLWKDYIADLSGQPWIKNALPFALKGLNIDGKQMGMPVAIEGYGYIYNKDIFQEDGITTLPTSLSQLTAAAAKIKADGTTPFATGYATWWVTGLHLINIPFAQQPDPQAFIAQLNAGQTTMAGNKMFQDLKNIVDLTVKYGEKNPLTTDHNKQVQLLANGEVAMIQQGVWKEIPIMKANPNAKIGLLPIPLNDSAQMNRIPVGVPFYFSVNKTAPQNVQNAAEKYLDFLADTPTGHTYLTAKFGFIPAFKDVPPEGLQGVGTDILAYANQDKTIPWVFGEFPDGFANEVSNNIQAYVAGKQDWNTTLQNFDSSWQKLKK